MPVSYTHLLFQIVDLHLAADLDAVGIEILVISRQDQPRTVHISTADGDLHQILRRIGHFQVQLLGNFAQRK